MAPFGETVLAWRLARGLRQADLASMAKVSRPNLSAIERGDREVTLRTLRALALALEVRPGVLADGETPGAAAPPLGRASMERIAIAAVRGQGALDERERRLAAELRGATTSKRQATSKRGRRRADRSYFALRTAAPPEVVASLVDRVGVEMARG